MGNMDLWERVATTPPDRIKQVNQRGGFSAIDAQYQRKRATAEFGIYGEMWGVKDLAYGYVRDGQNEIVEIYLEAIFWYISPESGEAAAFQISSDMPYKVGNDSRKKLLTDVTTKGLSFLGFNSDIFEGFGPLGAQENKNLDKPPTIDDLKTAIGKAQTPEKMLAIRDRWKEAVKDSMTAPDINSGLNWADLQIKNKIDEVYIGAKAKIDKAKNPIEVGAIVEYYSKSMIAEDIAAYGEQRKQELQLSQSTEDFDASA